MSASEAARIDWPRRVATEYAVSAFAQDLALRLTMFGAPATFIEQALHMALDELAHATDAAAVSAAAGATTTPVFDPATFAYEREADPAFDIAVAVVPSLCLGEVLALRIIHHERAGAREPVVVAALDRVVHDEPRHAALGWQALDWLLDSPRGADVHAYVARRLPAWVEQLRRDYAGEAPLPHLAAVTDEDRAWGIAPVGEIHDIFHTTVERDWLPRLARRGFALN